MKLNTLLNSKEVLEERALFLAKDIEHHHDFLSNILAEGIILGRQDKYPVWCFFSRLFHPGFLHVPSVRARMHTDETAAKLLLRDLARCVTKAAEARKMDDSSLVVGKVIQIEKPTTRGKKK